MTRDKIVNTLTQFYLKELKKQQFLTLLNL